MDQNDRLIAVLEKIEARLDTLDVTMVKNTMSLEEHIKRTNLLEEDFKPVKKHVELVNTASKIVSGVVGAAIVAKQLGLF
jgi:hypothetical protein